MQPCFAGWAMVECDIAGQDAPKPKMATLHPIKKKSSLLLSQPLGAQLWLGVAQIPEQGAQERSSSLHPSRHECWGLCSRPSFAPQL